MQDSLRIRGFLRPPTGLRWVALLTALLGGSSALRAASAEPESVPDRQSVEMLAAHAVARVALMDLRIVGEPTPRDYRIAEELFATAATLLPNDQTILRLYLEAAAGANDGPTVREITRRLVKLDPADTVSQLRTISARISELQTTDQRLAAYDRFLGEAGNAIDDSVRSRLALDAALLYRERGEMDNFGERLSRAIQLDPTNKDAATLALTFYQPKAADGPAGRLDLLFQVLWGDPFDSSVYSSIVSELLSHGAYNGALRFAELQRRLANIQAREIPDSDQLAYDLAEWNASGPEAVLRRLDDRLEKLRQQVIEQRGQAQDLGLSGADIPSPERIHLPAGRERSRVLCAIAVADRDRAAPCLGEFAQIVGAMTRDAADPSKRSKGVSEERAVQVVRDARVELTWLRLLGGLQIDEARADLADLRAAGGLEASVLARLDAWATLRTGTNEEAERAFAAMAASDDIAALGLAVCAEARADRNVASVRFEELFRRDAGNFIGAFAATRRKALTGERPRPDESARILEQDAAGVPASFDAMIDNPRRVMALEVKPLRTEIIPTDRTPVMVTIRNVSGLMLAMGPDKPICSRLLFAPGVDIGPDVLPTYDLVWIGNLDRRLRLDKNESVGMIVWPDIGPISADMELSLSQQARVRWRVFQGFEFSDQRLWDTTPMMLTTDIPPMIRRLPNRSDSVFESLKTTIQSGSTRDIADAILSIKYQLADQVHTEASLLTTMKEAAQKGNSLPSDERRRIIKEQERMKVIGGRLASERDQLMEMLAGRLTQGSTILPDKILMLCLTPTQANMSQALRVDQVAIHNADEDVLAVELAARVVSPDDPFLGDPAVQRSPRLAALARLVKERLQAKIPTAATSHWTVTDLVGPGYEKTINPAAATPNPDRSSLDPESQFKYIRPIVPTVQPDHSPVPSVP
jgi:hypothetical protein